MARPRPVQLAEVRERIRQALEVNPGGSLRTIAELAGRRLRRCGRYEPD